MGAGHINPIQAFDPGLIYDIETQDYENLLCSLNRSEAYIANIIKSTFTKCSSPSSDLNYPSFVSMIMGTQVIDGFKRTVTNVGKGPTTYKVTVTTPQGSIIRVSPKVLEFRSMNEKKKKFHTLSF